MRTDLELFGASITVRDTFSDHTVGHFAFVIELQHSAAHNVLMSADSSQH